MPSPREQPNPPSRNRRRQDPPAPGSWLWLVLLLMLVFGLLFLVGTGSGASVPYSDFLQIAAKGAPPEGKAKDKQGGEAPPAENHNIEKVVFIGPERIEGELKKDIDLNKILPGKNLGRLRPGGRFTVLVPESEIRSGQVTQKLTKYSVPHG